ncbi:hypothetical protein K2V56_01915 [Staphylococcus chromogenes]|uniref:hypothetical protein n=1 Tax=Staphylococcus chromogenes TaxID=46126 RepID=UPI001E4D064E|nr:hypothetical protein [Staphylococcus chromogenes]MCD8904220.1 hypothetical protein [Staphylococcus chromogenes]
MKKNASTGTFKENKMKPIHRWYPYIEGYSYNFIESELQHLQGNIHTVYDPFGGSGTTSLVASKYNIRSFYSETNPVMQFVANTKINITRQSLQHWKIVSDEITNLIMDISEQLPISKNVTHIHYEGFEKYYDSYVLKTLLFIKKLIKKNCVNDQSYAIATLALISILVYVSKMVRRSDLRFAKEKEKNEANFHVKKIYLEKLDEIMNDIMYYGDELKQEAVKINDDARSACLNEKISTIITSPPYLNGTNYIRNTKLELKMLDIVINEKELSTFHSKGIRAGINSISKRNKNLTILPVVRNYVSQLEKVTYDSRIPLMIAGYFYDMNTVISNLSRLIEREGSFILDIGDSQFSGIHIPTHQLLGQIAENNGFKQLEEDIIRKRRSYNGMELSQRVLRFKKN